MTILFVEDDPDDVFLIQHTCKKLSVTDKLHFLGNGREAVEFLNQTVSSPSDRVLLHPLLIFVDLNMPEMNGFEVLQWLRASPHYRTTPALVFSTSENGNDVRRAYDAGANAYLVKPNSIHLLSEVLSSALKFWTKLNKFSGTD